MWKVVAADDEGYIREALQKLINWEKMDCSLESVVSDGQELLEKIRGEMPDIVITDIHALMTYAGSCSANLPGTISRSFVTREVASRGVLPISVR